MTKHSIDKFIVNSNDSLKKVLNKIELNESGIVFCVDSNYRLIGSLSDGDVRRKIIQGDNIDNLIAKDICNPDCHYSYDYKISKKNKFALPVVDSSQKIIDIILPNSPSKIKSLIGKGIYIIAEIGNNHQGDIKLGKELIDLAVESGANAIKFQHRNMSELYSTDSIESLDLSTQYTIDLLTKYNLPFTDLTKLFEYTIDRDVDLICTPFDTSALDVY